MKGLFQTVVIKHAYSLIIYYSLSAECSAAAKQLHLLIDVINQTVGDALSDILLVETVLHAYGWSVSDWDAAYTDLPNRQMKVNCTRVVLAKK